MHVTATTDSERAEVGLVLESGLFDKAPRLGRFFRFICDRHFDGRADEIKEYSIALEALGRSAEFDPKKDSIVRVEAHRLRKRLEEYYRGPGAHHPVQISVPCGQYRPHFVVKDAEAHTAEEVSKPVPARDEPPPEKFEELNVVDVQASVAPVHGFAGLRRWAWWAASAFVILAISGTLGFKATHRRAAEDPPANEVWSGTSSEPASGEFRILAGYHGAPYVDRQGHSWAPDAFYRGGTSFAIPADHFIEAQPDPHLLRSQRSGQFRYDIPLRQGSYELHLYFAEIEYGRGNPKGGGESTRVFSVSVNGVVYSAGLDPLAEAGSPNRLTQRVIKDVSPAEDGKLHLNFDPGAAPAFLNAIEILPCSPGRVHPVRIVTQLNPVTDIDGRVWAADEYFSGGNSVFRRNAVINASEKALYGGERYGNFSYRIPLAPGKYRLTLHFAETWFGTPESHEPALDSRVFNVFANGVALLRDYQVGKDAGGANRGVEKVFRNVQPNAQGALLLEFVPIKNYAEVNAIEVVEESD